MIKADIDRVKEWIKSPIPWVEDMFGLAPQPLKKGFVVGVNTKLSDIDHRWFEPFVKGKHITWQQWVILMAVERGVANGKRFISIVSGRGIGKTSTMALILLWFLTCYKGAQIPCTAPSRQQMYDVLWKEVAIWHSKLPEEVRDKLMVESSYIRVKESPMTWFARAATARKDKPDALAGIHGDNVFMMVDESSGVDDEVFTIGKGALTNENAFILLISNYRRLSGFFHNTRKDEFDEWEKLAFSAIDSPIVSDKIVNEFKRYGENSNEYRVEILGQPPNVVEEIKGYYPLLKREDLRFTLMNELVQPIVMGIDPSGEGRNKTCIVLRDPFKAVIAGVWDNLKPKEVVEKSVVLQEELKIMPENIILDSFGVGAETMNEFMSSRRYVQGILVGNKSSEPHRFSNMKSEMYWRLREWIVKGGILVGTFDQWEDILNIMYTSEMSRVKMMSKKMMRDAGYKSPDEIEALMLTFLREEYETPLLDGSREVESFDPYKCL